MCLLNGKEACVRSFAKYTDTDQGHGLHDNGCHLAFMTHYNGDLEGPLDEVESSSMELLILS